MKYTYIKLTGFKRFLLNQIDHFEMDIVNPVILILGKNSVGKTSLLYQLTPLPANPNDFSKNGSKEIRITHNKCNYILKSIFSPSQKHSFIKDDIELNDGGTVTVQKELVKTHFNITFEIQSLIMGEEKFTSMSPSRRKEWLITLCDTDYDYAIGIYNKIKERHRDVLGALKVSRMKLLVETEKTIKSDEEQKLKNEVQLLHDQLNTLLEYRKPVESDLDVLDIKKNSLSTQLFKLAKSLETLYGNGIKNIDDLAIERINKRITHFTTLNRADTEVYNTNQVKIDILRRSEKQTIQSLTEKLDNVNNDKILLSSKLLFNANNFDSSTLLAFQSVKETLMDISSNIPSNADKKYNNTALLESKETLGKLQIKKQGIIENLNVQRAKLVHMTTHKDKPDLSCPKCQYKFSLHYNDDAYTQCKSTIENLENILENEINKEIQRLENYITDCNQYSVLYRQYTQCVNNYSVLKPYWDYLIEKKTIVDNPLSMVNEVILIENDIKNQIQYDNYSKEIVQLNSLLSSLNDVGGVDLNTLQNANDLLNKRIESHVDALQSALERKKEYTNILSINREIKSLKVKIENCMNDQYNLYKEEVETIRRQILNAEIKRMQSKLASKEHILTTIKTQLSIISNLNMNIEELEKEEIALNVLSKQLSPADGLIAEGLFGFINGFLKQINTLIKKVWTYPLEVLICNFNESNTVDLDYKFPMRIGYNKTPITDINRGSKGIMEIIDLAFQLSAIRYLGLQNTPLMLDEIASSADSAHKTAIINLVKNLIEQQIYSQVFMISHDYAQYSALANADFVALSTENILLPEKYNTRVKLSE